MDIIIEQPIWLSIWALLLYALILIALASIALRIIVLRKQRKISDDKIRFFVNTAHDIRTPLTLIKAPLEELNADPRRDGQPQHGASQCQRPATSYYQPHQL